MNILMMVTWYTKQGMDKLEAGVFHNEQSVALNKYANMAIYYPYDTEIEEEMTKQVEWDILTYRGKFYPGRLLKNRRKLCRDFERIIKEFHPDVIHAHCANGAGYNAVYLGKKYHIPVVITEHSPLELSHIDKPGLPHYMAGKAFSNSQANICVSVDSMNKLQAAYPRCNFKVIYNGIIIPEYTCHKKRYYKEGYTNIVIVAVLYDLEVKGLKYLLEAVKRLKDSGEKVYLHHIGGGEYLPHFEDVAKSLQIEDCCTFYGRRERKELYEIVSEMDLFVSSSLLECSGVSVEEAMLMGKPVLGTNSGGVDSLLPEKAGMIVQKADAQALVDGVLAMREHLGDFDRTWISEYALGHFEIDHISKKYMELYQSLV